MEGPAPEPIRLPDRQPEPQPAPQSPPKTEPQSILPRMPSITFNVTEVEGNLDNMFTYLRDIEKKLFTEIDRAVPNLFEMYTLGMDIRGQSFTQNQRELLKPFHQYVLFIYGVQEKLLNRDSLITKNRYLSQTNQILIPNYELNEEQQKTLKDLVVNAALLAKDKLEKFVEMFVSPKISYLQWKIENNKLELSKLFTDLSAALQDAQDQSTEQCQTKINEHLTKINQFSKELLEHVHSDIWQSMMKEVYDHLDEIIANQKELPVKIMLSFV